VFGDFFATVLQKMRLLQALNALIGWNLLRRPCKSVAVASSASRNRAETWAGQGSTALWREGGFPL
jgi:hypothetical protein